MNEYFNFNEVCTILEEDFSVIDRSKLITSSESVPKNRFRTRVEGFVIQDSYNNPIFPIENPPIDKYKGYLNLIFRQYIAKYQKQNDSNVLPWHFVIEGSPSGYVVYNTRPLNITYPFSKDEIKESIKKNNVNINDSTILETTKDIQQMYHILIVGNSFLDVYLEDLYEKIGNFTIGPFLRENQINPTINNGIFTFNLGHKFNTSFLLKHIKKL